MIASAGSALGQCEADANRNGTVEVHELVAAVNEALDGCATPTHTPVRPTPTATPDGSGLAPLIGTWTDGVESWTIDTIVPRIIPRRVSGSTDAGRMVGGYESGATLSAPHGEQFILIARDRTAFTATVFAASLVEPDTLSGVAAVANSEWPGCGLGPDWGTAAPFVLRRAPQH